jgi:phosphopantetheinyl transferase
MSVLQTRSAASLTVVARRYAPLRNLDEVELRGLEACLGARERAELARLRDLSRRRAWLLGRMLARQLLHEARGDWDASEIEILSRDAQGRLNRPRIFRGGVEQSCSLSISHAARGAMAVLCGEPGVTVGVDLAPPEPLSGAFVQLWFTPGEREWCRESDSPDTSTFIWAAKEAIYKAVNQGESFVPRDVEIRRGGGCLYRKMPLANCRLERQLIDRQIAVIATIRSDPNPNSN